MPLWSVGIDTGTVWGDTFHPDYDKPDVLEIVVAKTASVPDLRSGAVPGTVVLKFHHREPLIE